MWPTYIPDWTEDGLTDVYLEERRYLQTRDIQNCLVCGEETDEGDLCLNCIRWGNV